MHGRWRSVLSVVSFAKLQNRQTEERLEKQLILAGLMF